MAELRHGTDEWRAGEPLRVGDTSLLPIERFRLHAGQGGAGAWLWASKEPVALVVRDGAGLRVVGIARAGVTLDALRDEVPGFEGALTKL